jgi:hypothetical protein
MTMAVANVPWCRMPPDSFWSSAAHRPSLSMTNRKTRAYT